MINLEMRICPICGKDNDCMKDKNCWCIKKEIPKELIQKVPIEKKGKACICRSCVEEFELKRDN